MIPMNLAPLHRRCIPALAILASLNAAAQTETPTVQPRQDPALTDPSLDDSSLDRQRRQVTDEVVAPLAPRKGPTALPSVPGLSSIDYNLPNRKFFPEGTLLTGLVGTLVRSPMDDVIFLPDLTATDASGTATTQPNAPAMVLLPTQKLAQLTAATRGSDPDTRVAVSGQVFVYRNRQFLLPTTFAVRPKVSAAPVPSAPAAVKPATDPVAPANDPRVDDLIRDLESMRGPARVMDPAEPTPVTRPDEAADADSTLATDQALTPEGTLIVNRRGRLIRSAATQGRIAMSFDNDPDSPSVGAMVVLPCTLLRSMEEVLSTKGEDVVFNVSGRVLTYEGQNFLLPVLFQVRQTSDIRPQQ